MTLSDLVVESRRLRGQLTQAATALLTVQQAIQDKAREMTREQMRLGSADNDPSGIVYLRYAQAGGRAAAAVIQALSRMSLLDRMVAEEQVQQERVEREVRAKQALVLKQAQAETRERFRARVGHGPPPNDPLAELYGALAPHALSLLLLRQPRSGSSRYKPAALQQPLRFVEQLALPHRKGARCPGAEQAGARQHAYGLDRHGQHHARSGAVVVQPPGGP